MLNPNFKSVVPAALLDTPNWVVWRLETRHEKQTKIPYQAVPVDGDPKARSNDPSTWAHFNDAFAEASAKDTPWNGMGFMLIGSKYTGIDFDGLAANRIVDPYVASILKIAHNPYAEISPSGEGIRFFVEGTKLPQGKRKFSVSGPAKFGAEIYSGAENGRYLTVTGDKIAGSGDSIPALEESELELIYVLVSQILDNKFKALWLNDQKFIANTYGADQSRADAALCALLVPLLNHEAEKIEAAFSVSELGQRAKWKERKDYRERTIKNALSLPPLASGLIMPGQNLPKNQAPSPQPAITRTMSMTRADKTQVEVPVWLWPNRIAADHINVFSGEPDMGKGVTWSDLVARLTTHRDFPDCPNDLPGPTDVVIMSSEDDVNATVVPRLIAAGADLTRVHFATITENVSGTVTEGTTALDRDLPALEQLLEELGIGVVSLIIVDPIIAFVGDADPNKDKDVRPIFTRMKTFAKKNKVAWLTVNHFNKNSGATSINRTSGAKTFISAPRATWMFAKDPDDPNRRLMMKGKGNLARQGIKTLVYRIVETFIKVNGNPYVDSKGRPVGVPRTEWGGETDHNVEDVLAIDSADSSRKSQRKCEELITKLLNDAPNGVLPASMIYSAGEAETPSLSSQQLKRAKAALNTVEVFKIDRWYWAKDKAHMNEFRMKYFLPGGQLIVSSAPKIVVEEEELVET